MKIRNVSAIKKDDMELNSFSKQNKSQSMDLKNG